MKSLIIALLMLWMVPGALLAGTVEKNKGHETTWQKFNDAVVAKTSEIKWLVFGPILGIIGTIAICYAVFLTVSTSSSKPLLSVVGIGILVGIVPHFIDTIFGGMLP